MEGCYFSLGYKDHLNGSFMSDDLKYNEDNAVW